MISIEEALQAIEANVSELENETIELSQSVGRVLAVPVKADVDSPPHRKSVMDGYAVRSDDVVADCRLNVLETVIAGAVPTQEVVPGSCSRIMTGAPMPNGADAVIMVEQANQDGDNVHFSIDAVETGKHTLEKAASFGKGEIIFETGHRIRALDIGLLAEVGAHHLTVKKQATAAVIPTGNELVGPNEKPGPGQIRNSNGPMLVALLQSQGMVVDNVGVARDDRDELEKKVLRGLQSDILVLSGGVSAGTMDLVPEILQKSGVNQAFHKVRVKPGKPVWFGVRESNAGKCFVFGLPGNPVSSLVGFELFVKAAIRKLRSESIAAVLFKARLTDSHVARGDRPTYWPAVWCESDDETRNVTPLKWMGSSDLRALGKANALIFFPGAGEYSSGEFVEVLAIT